MIRVALLMLPETGHLLPTFQLARELSAAGHHITYLAPPSLTALVAAYGFNTVAISFQEYRGEHSIRYRLEQISPDLLLLDEPFFVGIRLMKIVSALDIACLCVNSALPNECRGKFPLPPNTTHIVPNRSFTNRLQIRLSWGKVLAVRYWHYLRTGLYTRLPRLYDKKPELVFCSKHIDFDRADCSSRHYLGPSICLIRPEQSFPWQLLRESATLVYCSFGTQSHKQSSLVTLLTRLIEAVSLGNNEQLVISVDELTTQALGSVPSSVIIVSSAPQLLLLQRAAVAVIHGGLGGIKECIFMGVPMVVVPQLWDQPGNAARVEYHGLGTRCVKSAPSARELRQLLDFAQAADIRNNISIMRRRFQQEQDAAAGASIVERYHHDAISSQRRS